MLLDSVKQTIEREHLVDKGDRILVALSGGADSVCLLHCLKKLEEQYDVKIYAAHLNHKIRGIDAQRDAMYAAKLCDSMDITFFVKAVDVPSYAKEHKLTMEEAARKVRYEMLFEIKDRIRADKIAVAHNLDDQVETVMMRLLRGSGTHGLKGMDYKREDGIIRPLMDVMKADIISYCEVNRLQPCIDKTNFESEYTRNNIRLNLIPYIEKEFSPTIKTMLSRMANILREDNSFLEEQSQRVFFRDADIAQEHVKLQVDDLKMLHPAIVKRVLRLAIKQIMLSLEGIENVHIEDILSLISSEKTRAMLNLPKGLIVYKRPEGIFFTRKPIQQELTSYQYVLTPGENIYISEVQMKVESKLLTKEKCMALPIGNMMKAFDIDKIKGDLVIRNRQDGDKMRPMGLGGTKKLKDIFIDLKIPREKRDSIPIVCDEQGILWIVGYKISEDYKIDENTQNVLRISFKENK